MLKTGDSKKSSFKLGETAMDTFIAGLSCDYVSTPKPLLERRAKQTAAIKRKRVEPSGQASELFESRVSAGQSSVPGKSSPPAKRTRRSVAKALELTAVAPEEIVIVIDGDSELEEGELRSTLVDEGKEDLVSTGQNLTGKKLETTNRTDKK
jgi:hypothetical protein